MIPSIHAPTPISSPSRFRPLLHTLGSSPTRGGALASLLVLALLFAPSPLHAQEQSPQKEMYRVETVEGEVLIGTLVSETDEAVVISTRRFGEVSIERTSIERIEKIDPSRLRDGEYWFPNPQSTRYFFTTNALSIPKGEGYYQNTWVLLNNVNYGVSDNFSIGAGTVPVFLFGADALPIWVLPKISISTPQNNVHLAAGAVLGGVIAEESVGVGLLYGTTTVGSRDHNATLGIGYGYAGDNLSDTPAVNVSGMTRVSKTFYLLSENYVFPGSEATGILSVGARWAPENFAVDFGLFRPLAEADGFIAFPWLGVTIPFGQ